MNQLRFTIKFDGGKAKRHRLSAKRFAKIIQNISDDLLDVCRIISSNDINTDSDEIARGCRLYIVGSSKPTSLSQVFETESVNSEWPVQAGRIFVSSLSSLSIEDDGHLPEGINYRILEHAKEYCSPSDNEYEVMQLTIRANGQPSVSVDFDQYLKVAVEKKLSELTASAPYVIHGHMIQGILYGLEDQDYNDPSASVTVEVDTGDGMRWVCHVKRDLMPKDIANHWTERVIVSGTGKFRKRKPEMEAERIELLGKELDIDDVLEGFIKKHAAIWKGENLSDYMSQVRERDE